MTERTVAALSSLPALSEEELNDAAFRAQDLGWAVLLDAFTHRQENEGLTYKALGDRIGRSKQQVQRWLSSPFGMSTRTLGLLAEGLDMDLDIVLEPRLEPDARSNYMHPAERAKSERRHIATCYALGGVTTSRSVAQLVTLSESPQTLNAKTAITDLRVVVSTTQFASLDAGQREFEHG